MGAKSLATQLIVIFVTLSSVIADEKSPERQKRSHELIERLDLEDELKRVKRLDEEDQLVRVSQPLERYKRVKRSLKDVHDALERVKRYRRDSSADETGALTDNPTTTLSAAPTGDSGLDVKPEKPDIPVGGKDRQARRKKGKMNKGGKRKNKKVIRKKNLKDRKDRKRKRINRRKQRKDRKQNRKEIAEKAREGLKATELNPNSNE